MTQTPFHQQRRQQFLVEPYLKQQLTDFEAVIDGPEGLEENLRSRERERGWHMSLARGVGFEKFNRLLLRYTAGEPIDALRNELGEVIAAYERYGEYLWKHTGDRNDWVFEFDVLDDYCQLMQLVGLCFLLHRRDLLPRIAALQDGLDAVGKKGQGAGGADWNFEEFMSFGVGPENRYESETIHWAEPYEALADAMSSTDNAAALQDLERFLKHWYKDLEGVGWHDSHKPNEKGDQGGYYGYWSFEAGAAVLLLGIEDDSSLHQYLYYPKDMVAWARSHSNLALSSAPSTDSYAHSVPGGQPCPQTGWWHTLALSNSRRYFQVGDLMPIIEGSAYGQTFWLWDVDQQAPVL